MGEIASASKPACVAFLPLINKYKKSFFKMAAWGEIEHYLKAKFSLGIPKYYQTYIFLKYKNAK